jgi:hypothetical protein
MAKTLLLIFALVLPAIAQRQQWGAYERAVKLPTHPLTLVGPSRDGYDITQAVRSDGSYALFISNTRFPLDKELYFIDNRIGYEVTVEYLGKIYLRRPISRVGAASALWAPDDCAEAMTVWSPMVGGNAFKASACTPGEPDPKYFTAPQGFREISTWSEFHRLVREAHGSKPDPPGRWETKDADLARAKAAGPFYDAGSIPGQRMRSGRRVGGSRFRSRSGVSGKVAVREA